MSNPDDNAPKGGSYHPFWGCFFCLPNVFMIGLFWLIGASGEWGLLLPALMLGTASVGALLSQRHNRPYALPRAAVLMASLFIAASAAFLMAGTLTLTLGTVIAAAGGVISCRMAYELATS